MQISPLCSSSLSSKLEPVISTLPDKSALRGSNYEQKERRRKSENRESDKIASHDRSCLLQKSKPTDKGKKAHLPSIELIESSKKLHMTDPSKYHQSIKLSRHNQDEVELLHPIHGRSKIPVDFQIYF